MNGDAMNSDIPAVSCTITLWLQDVGRLLQAVQLVLENAKPSKGAPAEVSELLGKLPPMVRECRSQIPTHRMIEVWVREVAAGNVGGQLKPGKSEPARLRARREAVPA